MNLLLLLFISFLHIGYQGEGHQALITLQKGVADHFSVGARSRRDSSQDVQAEKLSHAKVGNP